LRLGTLGTESVSDNQAASVGLSIFRTWSIALAMFQRASGRVQPPLLAEMLKRDLDALVVHALELSLELFPALGVAT
jgi:hypothetical protein